MAAELPRQGAYVYGSEAWLAQLVVELGRLEKMAHDAGDRRLTEELGELADKVVL